MHRGYVRLWRKSKDCELLSNHRLWALWCWCLLKASHQAIDVKVGLKTVHLEAGQFVFGRSKASQELNMSEGYVRLGMQQLVERDNITIKSTNKYSVVTIVNWATYQVAPIEIYQQNYQQNTTAPIMSKTGKDDDIIQVTALVGRPSNEFTSKMAKNDQQKTPFSTNKKEPENCEKTATCEEGKSEICQQKITKVTNKTAKNDHKQEQLTRTKRKGIPSLEEIAAYCSERNSPVNPQRFYDYYESVGWVIGNNRPIKDWKACVRTWEQRETTVKIPTKNYSFEEKLKKFKQQVKGE